MMEHGGDIYTLAKELDCQPQEIVDFSSNINCYQIDETLTYSAKTLAPYPDNNYPELKSAIATRYKIKEENIALFGGATDAIYQLLTQLKGKKIYLYAPLYGEYKKAALKTNKYLTIINRIEDIDGEVEKKSIVIFVNPATPDGSYYELDELFLMWKKQKCSIILDESFIEFEEHKSLRNQITDYKKLYIIQSFSKFYSCAGVRIGAVFSHKKNIRSLEVPPWRISVMDAAFLQKRLRDDAFVKKSKELHQEQKAELKKILTESGVFEVIVESDANFILTQSSRAEEIFKHLLAHKIMVRECASFDFLDASWLRFAVKDKASHAKLKEALSALA
ncbi:MAG: aminotransferase class I/II-fold pyridoxal phosphate-dependent enzyme [Sulfurimonas sp.]